MIRIIDNKGSGKTSRLMLIAKENNGIIVCSNPHAIANKAIAYGIAGIEFVSYDDFINKNYDTNKKVYIDELEYFTNHFVGKIDGYSLSKE